MATTRYLLGGLLLLSVAAACTSTAQSAGPESTSRAPAAGPAPATTTVAPPPGLGAVHKTTVLALTGSFTGPGTTATTALTAPGGGAKVTVTWHDEKAMSLDDLLPGCRAAVLSAEPSDGTVLTAVAAEVKATFPAGSGTTLTFSYGDGPQAASADRAYACAGTQPTAAQTAAPFTLTPQSPTTTVMWVRFGQGKIPADNPAAYTITETTHSNTCTPTCTTTYG